MEKKQNVPVSNKDKEQIISVEETPSDQQARILTDTNTADQVNKFNQKRQISKEAVHKKTFTLQPEHMQEFLSPSASPTRLTIPTVKPTEQTQSDLSRLSKAYGSIVAKGKENQGGSRYSDHIVTINIEHIEVRAIMPQKSLSTKMQPSSQALSLRDYLKKRSEGRL